MKIPKIINIISEQIAYEEPLKFCSQFADEMYTSLLIGKGDSGIGKLAVIGRNPHTIFSFENNRWQTTDEKGIVESDLGFWVTFNQIWANCRFADFPFPARFCGLLGYLSYEGLHQIEKIEKKTINNYQIPVLTAVLFNQYYVFDLSKKKQWSINVKYNYKSSVDGQINLPVSTGFSVKNLEPECSAEEYCRKIEKIQEYIREGDVYEVNLTQQIKGDFFGNSFALFKKLFQKNTAPFSAYLNFETLKIISNSPELFLKCQNRKVETRPIKGTINRGVTPEQDRENKSHLLISQKDQAELYMIIDLLRNDLGKVCEYGSIKVIKRKKIEAYKNVFHLVGIIEGKMRENVSYPDLIRACFPGGSITGCPKIRCMEIIEELETFSRNIYTGTVFLMNRDFLTSNIVIRTAVINNNTIFLNSGGAITIDSDPEQEYEETEHKLKNIRESIKND